ncbi:MAG: hypothetical protein F4Y45_07455 [Acidobacteria bacterium]|nr:hypothetical protein [Acidobacteriota bacterium]MXZ70397.1 hypothetical protein [Acidobacteriota bacterium]MYD70764.1 hypothetical protein [Acidobacteriota bacterium]MYJ06336.1 hypothetical protein [Acidobacteriota bacterium]
MQKLRQAALLGALLGLAAGGGLAGAQEAVSVEDYEDAMQELRYLVSDASIHLDASYWGDLGEDTDKMREQFARVVSFWEAQGQAEAVELAGNAIEAARAIARASGAQDPSAATAGLEDLRGACAACHEQFREETADGFRIKPSALQ